MTARTTAEVNALVSAYEALLQPVTAHGRVRCSTCSAQYARTRLGLELCTRNVSGVDREMVCTVCSGRGRR